MINLNELPQDKKGKEEHLLARKLQLLELISEMTTSQLVTPAQVHGLMWSTIEEIDGMLDE